MKLRTLAGTFDIEAIEQAFFNHDHDGSEPAHGQWEKRRDQWRSFKSYLASHPRQEISRRMTPTETPELKPKRNGVIRCTALLGRFPVGVPVLIHDQLNGDGLETHIGIITKCEDGLCLAETYYGKISAIIVTGSLQTNSVTGLEHYSKRISACYWLHLSEADLMIKDFARSWNADKVRERVEYLMASVRTEN